jgi:hypothetical protein
MNLDLLTTLLNGSLCITALVIGVRAVERYLQLRSPRLFILGLSMGTIALTAATDTMSGAITSIHFNTNWFLYIGQTVSLGYIFLSLFCSSDSALRRLLLWQVLSTVPLLLLLLLALALPDFPNPATQVILSGSRSFICFLIFGRYIYSFIFTKETRFGFMMSIAFLLLSIGYFLILPGILFPHMERFDQMGDIIRIGGLVTLLVGYIWG